MLKLMRDIQTWVEKPGYQDFDDRQNAFYIQAGALVTLLLAAAVGVVYAIAGQWGYVLLMTIEVLVHAAIIWLIRGGLLKRATQFFLAFQLFFLTYGLLSGGGLHSLSAVLYPVILIFASLLLDRKSFYVHLALCIASVGLVVFAENQHITRPYIPDPPDFPLFFTFSLMLVGSALLIRFITENLQFNLRKTRQNEQEMAVQSAMLDHVGQAVVACAADSTITYWNQAASDYYGWQAKETLGKKYSDIVPVTSSPEIMAAIGAALRSGKVWSGELNVQKRDQTFLPTISTLAPLRDSKGQMTGWVGIAADLSERRRTDEALQESEEKYHKIFNNEIDAICIFDVETRKILDVNNAYLKLYGYTRAEVLQLTTDDISAEHEKTSAAIQKARAAGDVVIPERNHRKKDGTVFQVELSAGAYTWKGRNVMFALARDITERKQAEAALRESESKFHGFFSHALDAMFLVDEHGLVIEINQATEDLFQLNRDEVIGQPIWDIQFSRAPENLRASISVDSIRAFVEEALSTGQASWLNRVTDSAIQLPGGELRDIQQTAFAIPHGDKFWIASISRDMTESKQAEALRLQADADRGAAAMRQRLLDFSRELLSTVDAVAIFQATRHIAADLVPHDVFHPYWIDEVAAVLRPADSPYQKQVSRLFAPLWTIPLGQGIMGDVARKQQAECVNNSHLDPRAVFPPGVREQISQEHAIFLPIHAEGKVIGILALVRRTLPAFTPDEFEMAQLLMSLSEMALSNARIFSELEERVAERTAQLAASEERYRLISAVSSDYTFSSGLNDRGELALNWTAGAFEKITGYTLDEYIARGGWRAALHPQDVEQDTRDMAALNENRPVITEVRTFAKNGQVHWVRSYAHPVWDAEKNRLVGIYGAVQDITERKQVEAREARSREMLEKVVQLGKILTQTTNLQQCYTDICQCVRAGLGFDRVGLFLYDEETSGVHGILGTDRLGQAEDISDETFTAAQGTAWRNTLDDPRGIFYVADYATAYTQPAEMSGVMEHVTVAAWAGEKPIAFLTVDNLVSQRKLAPEQIEALQLFAGYAGLAIQKARLNDELEQRVEERTAQLESANRELESLSYTIGHDLRSPIRATVAYSHMLLDELSGQLQPAQENKLQLVNQVSVRMGQMVDDFLTFLRLNRSVLKKHSVEVQALVSSVIKDFEAEIAARKVTFSVLPMPACFADEGLLKNVYFHLISNALKFTASREQARVEIGATDYQGGTCYFVRDNGVGFDMKYVGKLFGVFQRLHHVDEFDGTGAGLAIVQRIIQRHGGKIWAEAEPDKGATFFFTLL